jgi:PAS domain S-box-containing protein
MTLHKDAVDSRLSESETKYQAVVENSLQAILISQGMPPRIVFVNSQCTELTGYKSEELLSLCPDATRALIHPQDRAVVLDRLGVQLDGMPAPSQGEFRISHRDGGTRWVKYSATPIVHDGKPSVLTVLADITGRKQAEIALQEVHDHLQRRVEERTHELETLYDVTAITSEPLSLPTSLALSLARTLDALRCPAGAIQLLDEAEQALYVAAQQGIEPKLLDQLNTAPAGSSPVAWVLQQGKPIVVSDPMPEPQIPQALRAEGLVMYVGTPIRVQGLVLGVFSVFGQEGQQFSVEDVALLASIADHIGVAVENAQLRELTEQAAALDERERLARELHDSVTQSLFSLTLFAETARQMLGADDLEELEQTLDEIDETAGQALKDMRLMLYRLRPPVLEKEGLVGALRHRLSAVEDRAGVKARVLTGELFELPTAIEESLYYIALEALNNALKHARASAVTVHIFSAGEQVVMEISDDGRGFDPESVRDRGGLGLANMRERAETLGGTMAVSSQHGAGSKVRVSLRIVPE